VSQPPRPHNPPVAQPPKPPRPSPPPRPRPQVIQPLDPSDPHH
jgi:hypothetical protein